MTAQQGTTPSTAPAGSPPDKYKLALSASKRLLDRQSSAVDSIQTKVGVLLGFAITALGIMFSLGEGWISAHRYLGLVSAGLLVSSTIVLAFSFAVKAYSEVPDPAWLWPLLNSSEVDGAFLQKKLIAEYTGAFTQNKDTRLIQFNRVNWGMGLLIAGMGFFVFGVLLFP